MSRTSVLLLTPVLPAERGNGLAMRAGLLLEGLARSCSVHVLVAPVFGGPGPPSALVDRLAASSSVLPIDRDADQRPDLLARLATPEQRTRAKALHPRPAACRAATLAAAEAVAAAAAQVDLVFVMRLYLTPLLDVILARADRPRLVLDVDDIESRTQPELGHPEEGRRFARLEAHYLPLLDHVLTCSEADADYLAARHRMNAIAVVPNAVRLPSVSIDSPRRFELLFVGNFSYHPNVYGARWLCREVVPRLDGARVALVGSSPAPDVVALASHDLVTLAADVPDVTPWYEAAAVVTVPVRAGGGTRIKILEAFAHRRPVVTTSAGARGLELAADGAALVSDTPDAFADACRRLLADPALANSLAQHGEATVRERLTVEVVAGAVDAVARDIVAA